jgi:Na+/phosphate symporter
MPKKTGSRSFDKEFLEKRSDTLQKFLAAICDHEELRCSIYFSAFVKFSDKCHFDQMKEQFLKEYSATSCLKENYSKKLFEGPKPVKLSDFRTKAGVVRSRITKELRDYAISSEELQKNCQNAYERLIDSCNDLMKDFDRVSDTITRLCDQISYLNIVHKRFNDQNKEGKWSLMQQMYQSMGTSLSKWGMCIVTQAIK